MMKQPASDCGSLTGQDDGKADSSREGCETSLELCWCSGAWWNPSRTGLIKQHQAPHLAGMPPPPKTPSKTRVPQGSLRSIEIEPPKKLKEDTPLRGIAWDWGSVQALRGVAVGPLEFHPGTHCIVQWPLATGCVRDANWEEREQRQQLHN